MNTRFLISVAASLLIMSGIAFSQGAYMNPGQSGLGVSGVFDVNSNAQAVGASAGYSLWGMLDLGFTYSHVYLNKKMEGLGGNYYNLGTSGFTPSATVYLFRQDTLGNPLSFALSGAYEWDSYSSHALDQLNSTLTAHSFIYGGSVFTNINTSASDFIQPSISFAVVNTSSNSTLSNYVSPSRSAVGVGSFGLSVVAGTSAGNKIAFTPGVSYSQGVTTFSLELDFVCLTSR